VFVPCKLFQDHRKTFGENTDREQKMGVDKVSSEGTKKRTKSNLGICQLIQISGRCYKTFYGRKLRLFIFS